MLGTSPELEVERSVRGQLYRGSGEVKATPMPNPPAPRGAGPLGRRFGGRYRLLERVGGGGMATVYRARDERLKRTVAVKVIDEHLSFDSASVRRFRQEAQLCAGLAHPNVVAILDAGVEPRDFTVMEYVPGVDAGKRLRSRGRLTLGEAVHVVAQVCEALAYAHDQDVVHQDVSPRNILIRQPDFTAKLADFGFAGTPGYVAPEILRGADPSPQSDLYSLGVVAYRLLAGPEPTAPPRRPLAEVRPRLPRRLSDALQQALAEEPAARQRSVAEFRAQLVKPMFPDAVRGELSSAA
jgi:eukaryotic-like serine/threonine-protein kinase